MSEATVAPNGAFELSNSGAGGFAARGLLTFANATNACARGLEALAGPGGGAHEVDLSGLTHSDSAGLAVLLEWLAAAKAAHRTLRYTHLPAGLAALGRISEVDELLERGV